MKHVGVKENDRYSCRKGKKLWWQLLLVITCETVCAGHNYQTFEA